MIKFGQIALLMGTVYCLCTWPKSNVALGQVPANQSVASIPLNDRPESWHTIEGSVIDESGQPVAGAHIVVKRNFARGNFDEYLHHGLQFSEFDRNLGTGKSTDEGKFRVPIDDRSPVLPLAVIAHRSGRAPAVGWWKGDNPVEIVLGQGTSLRGTVINDQDRPVANASVALESWTTYENNQAALASNSNRVFPEGHLIGETILIDTNTDSHGQFELKQVPRDRWVALVVRAEGYLPRCVIADSGDDPELETAANAPLFFDGSKIRLQPASRLEITTVSAEGQPVSLERAYISLRSRLTTGDFERDGAKLIRVTGNRAWLPVLAPGAQRVWLVPQVATGHISTFIDVNLEDPAMELRQRVQLQRGANIVGRVVDTVTDEPIEGAAIHYDPVSAEQFQEMNVCVPSAKTDRDGQFSMVVPPIDAHLRQIGRVAGYRSTTYDLNLDIRNLAISQPISPRINADTRVEFRLTPATRLLGQVVDAQGAPVPRARFSARERIAQTTTKPDEGVADDQGHFELLNIFAERSVDPRNQGSTNKGNPLSEVVYFWSPDGKSNAVIKLPWPAEEGIPDIRMQVALKPATAARGRFVDKLTGEAVAGVEVSALFPFFQRLSVRPTFSATNGEFFLDRLFAGEEFRLELRGEYIGRAAGNSPETLTLPAGDSHDLGDIPLIVYRDLQELLEVPDVSQLAHEHALRVLIQAQNRVRERITEIDQAQGGRSNWQSVASAEAIYIDRYGKAYLDLALRTQDPNLEFAILTAYLTQVTSPWAPPSFHARRAKQILIEKFLDREEMPTLLPQWLPEFEQPLWQEVFDRASDDRLKALANLIRVKGTIRTFGNSIAWMRWSDAEFEAKLDEAHLLWKAGIVDLGDQQLSGTIDPRINGSKLRSLVEKELQGLLSQLETIPIPDRARAARVEQIARRLLQRDR